MQDIERVAVYAKEISEFLMESELTDTRAFVRSFVKEIAVRPGKATIHYAIPTPPDNGNGGAEIAEITPNRRVMNTVHHGTPAGTRTQARGLGNRCSILLSYRGAALSRYQSYYRRQRELRAPNELNRSSHLQARRMHSGGALPRLRRGAWEAS